MLLVNRASVDRLRDVVREESPACSVDARRFRGNVVVDDAAPYAEDHWSTVRIADVVDAELCKPCSRCSIPAVDPDTGDSSAARPRRRALAPPLGRRPGHRQPSLARQSLLRMESRVSHRSTRSLTRAQSRRRRRRARDPSRVSVKLRPKVTTHAAFLESRLVTTPFFRGQVFPRPRLSIVVVVVASRVVEPTAMTARARFYASRPLPSAAPRARASRARLARPAAPNESSSRRLGPTPSALWPSSWSPPRTD